ncbi:MAG: RNB domain-containing ribonuclease, partial [Betaproteobacteria bacterium]|nr:RNB domain-containing ribonuclease [Betaproteobacteria bacterium]
TLQDAPHYFRRCGKGRYKKAPAEVVQQALAAMEKKKQTQALIDMWALELGQGQCPPSIKEQLYKILFKPDKNAPEYKAVVQAARTTQLAPLDLLMQAGAIESAYQFHWKRFLFDQFPKGTSFPELTLTAPAKKLPMADVQAFSIDDSSTTEIDDALSVQGIGSGRVTVGIHIAAPGLSVQRGDALDELGRARLSTVYMPGHKITMLPDAVVQHFTLQAGRDCPALSLYMTLDEHTLEVLEHITRVERVPIAHNLRHDQLDAWVTPQWLGIKEVTGKAGDDETGTDPTLAPQIPLPLRELQPELSFLYRLALQLKAQREQVRGKPESFNRPDFNFRLLDVVGPEPQGHEQVDITLRRRGAPLDLIVAEAMILANSTWGQWLGELGVPAIYRSQASLSPGIKVRMGTKPLPHAGIGVPAYAWSTSPLRRYTDLVNQWQILAAVQHGSTAALAAPFKPKDADLFAIISSFEAAYGAYNAYQSSMERFWTLQYIQQQGLSELAGRIIKDQLLRAEALPLVLPVLGAQDAARGAQFKVRLGDINFITLDVHGTVIERLDTQGTEDAQTDEDGGTEDVAGSLPLSIEVDVAEAITSAMPASTAPATPLSP